MNTQKAKQNRSAVRRRALLESQNVLFIDEASKMLEPIDFDDEHAKKTLSKNGYADWEKEVA